MSAAPTDLRHYLIVLVSLTPVQVVATMGFNQASAQAPAAAPALDVAAADVACYVSLADLVRRPSAVLTAIGAIVTMAATAMAFSTPTWPTAAVYAVCTILGGTAVGWNGVFIAESASSAPPGRAAEFTGATQLFVFCGALASPLLFRAVLAVTHSYEAGYLLLAAGVAVCSFLLGRAVLR